MGEETTTVTWGDVLRSDAVQSAFESLAGGETVDAAPMGVCQVDGPDDAGASPALPTGIAAAYDDQPRETPRPLVPRAHGKHAVIEAAHLSGRAVRTRGPGKGKRAETVHLLNAAIQALQNAREALIHVQTDMPKHERERLLIPVVSDTGFAGRNVAEALERWERGLM